MTTDQGGPSPRIRINKRRRIPDDDVGYGRPPQAHQFKPGQSGNPRGRRKGVKNEATILRELLQRKIEVRDRGRVRKITVLEGILTRFTEDSLKGNTKSAAFLLSRNAAASFSDAPRAELGDDDREIIAAFAQKYITGGQTKEPKS
jgi:hypothetical protein